MYPVLISSFGIVVGLLTLGVQAWLYPVHDAPGVEKALKGVLCLSSEGGKTDGPGKGN